MYLIRDIFHCKPGKAKELVNLFKHEAEYFKDNADFKNFRIMTDMVADYWTVVMHVETSSLDGYANMARSATSKPEVAQAFKNYMELVESGRREVWKLED